MSPVRAATSSGHHMGSLGEAIRQSRRGRFTIEELAKRAGVSAGLISQIEKGKGNPSFVNLMKLASALDLSLGAFFNSQKVGRQSMVVRRNERRKLALKEEGLVYEILSADSQQALRMVRFQLPAGFDNSERPFSHAGQECVFLLSGSIEAHIGASVFKLEEGDAISYDSTVPHWWSNTATKPAVLIRAATPPPF